MPINEEAFARFLERVKRVPGGWNLTGEGGIRHREILSRRSTPASPLVAVVQHEGGRAMANGQIAETSFAAGLDLSTGDAIWTMTDYDGGPTSAGYPHRQRLLAACGLGQGNNHGE